MNQYYESLGSTEKARYIAKLQAVGLTQEVDPYNKERRRNFETNMTIWPPPECSHILATLSLTQVGILSNSSYSGNRYRVINISNAAMLESCILGGLGMEEIHYAS